MIIILSIILLIVSISLIIVSLKYKDLSNNKLEIININKDIEQQNKDIEQQNKELQKDLSLNKDKLNSVKETIQTQQNILSSLNKTAEDLRQGAEQHAQQSYAAKVAALKLQYDAKVEEYRDIYYSELAELRDQLNEQYEQLENEQSKLKDLEDKQIAYIKAQLREEEKQKNQDFYRLVISENDQQEIKLLRNIQLQFSHKDVIDKLIWEVYYKPAFDILVSHVYNSKDKICGIYKITNLVNGQAYIGQSVSCKERAREHVKAGLAATRATNKLYQQMQDYGLHNFTFEVLEEVPRDKLNEREAYWIGFYHTKELGMNGTKGNTKGEKT